MQNLVTSSKWTVREKDFTISTSNSRIPKHPTKPCDPPHKRFQVQQPKSATSNKPHKTCGKPQTLRYPERKIETLKEDIKYNTQARFIRKETHKPKNQRIEREAQNPCCKNERRETKNKGYILSASQLVWDMVVEAKKGERVCRGAPKEWVGSCETQKEVAKELNLVGRVASEAKDKYGKEKRI